MWTIKIIAANNVIPVSFRVRQYETFSLAQARSTVWRLCVISVREKPRWVLVGLETDKIGNQENNAAISYHCNLTNMQVMLNHSTLLWIWLQISPRSSRLVYTSRFTIFLVDTMV